MQAFALHICPSRARLRKFWDSMEGSPQLHDHPMKLRPNWKDRAIPISFHGDGVPITGVDKSWSHSMTMYSWTSMVGVGSLEQLMNLIWAVFKDAISKGALKDT